jgi:UDP-glucose 4-epimerase
VIKDQDYVFHFAALPSHRLALEKPRDYALIDLIGTINILEAVRIVEPSPPILFASSNKVYGKKTEPYREDMPLNPEGPYAQAKACCEEWCRQYSAYYNLVVPVVRYHHVIGSRMQPDREVAIFTERVINNQPPIIHGHFEGSKFIPCAADYTHIYDAIDGTILVATKVRKGFDVFNLATGKVTTVLRIAELVMSYLGKQIRPIFKEMLPHESLIHCADITKIKKLGFEPKYSVEDGVRHYVEWRLKVGPREVTYK